MQRATAQMLPDKRRLHLQHGPIDLIVEAWGPGRNAGYQRAIARFETVLEELVSEISLLRRRGVGIASVRGSVALRMVRAVAPFEVEHFVTPMAAVAGAVADEVLDAVNGNGILKAYVNNGGDIALQIGAGHTIETLVATAPPARVKLSSTHPARGVATSGWGGRSHSLGIADSVTVLASTAAMADAAATLIANAVDLPNHSNIEREPALDLTPSSDLGPLLVTTAVPLLNIQERATALAAGLQRAEAYIDRNLIHGAYLTCQGETRVAGVAMNETLLRETADA